MAWSKEEIKDSYAEIDGLDAYADWLLGPGYPAFLPDDEESAIPFLIQLDDGAAYEQLGRIAYLPGFKLAQKGEGAEVPNGGFVTAFVPRHVLEELRRPGNDYDHLRQARKTMTLGSPMRQAAFAPERACGKPLPDPDLGTPVDWDAGTVIMAVIDDGIAFAHERFRTADGKSRVQCFWQQDGHPRSAAVPYGREHTRLEIDQLLQDWETGDSIDEPGLYRAAGLADFAQTGHKSVARRIAHGTHVLDLAAGSEPAADAGRRPIIAVQLPTAATADTSFALLTNYVLDAIDYILHRADLLDGDQTLPVVVNFSYGFYAGPHDGSHVLEWAIEQRIAASVRPLTVVLPAGNNQQGRHYANVGFARQNEVKKLPWRVHPDDRTSSFAELWMPYRPPELPVESRVELAFETPGGLVSPWLGEEDRWGVVLRRGAVVLAMAFYRYVPAPVERGVFILAISPTVLLAPYPANMLPAPAGTWRIHLRSQSVGGGPEVQAWVQRDDAPLGFPIRGRQSYFDAACYRRFDDQFRPIEDDDHPAQGECLVKRRSLVSALATGRSPRVAGGFRRRSGKVAPYSAGGPTTTPAGEADDPAARERPHVLLVSDDAKVLPGVLAAGSSSGSRVALSGSSVAAPQLARWIAQRLADGLPPDPPQAAALADPDLPPLPPDRGAGRLELPPLNRARRGRKRSHD